MHSIKVIFIIISLCLLASPVLAETYTVSPTGSQSDQNVINEALEKAAQDGGGDVYLKVDGSNNVFITDGPIVIRSSNIVLTGDPDVVIRVYSGSDAKQWFTGKNSIICSDGPVDNLEIYGFQIDGSCDELPFEYHHSRSDTAHDCERAIYINGQTDRFSTNIKIHDMQIENCFSDGIHVRMSEGVHCYNNFISNCQHEGIFWVSVKEGIAENNKIAGITSDCFRTDNGVNNLIQNNYFFSYTGNKNNEAPKGEQNGIQVADAGASHGYDASKKPTTTTNIEVKGNTFANTGSRAVWLDSTGKGYENVYIHDNEFVNVEVVTNQGESVDVNIEPTNEKSQKFIDTTGKVTPSKEMSEKVFSSIFDIFMMDVYTQAGENDTVILPDGVTQTPLNASWTVEQHYLKDLSYTTVYGPTEGFTEVKVRIGNKESSHVLMVGEKTGSKMTFSNCSIWRGELSHVGNTLQIDGIIEPDEIEITCISPKDEFKPSLKLDQVYSQKTFFHPFVKYFFLIIAGALGFIYFNLKFSF